LDRLQEGQMKAEIIRIGKNHRPLKAETVMAELKRTFPEFECIPYGNSGNCYIVKKSAFAGAKIDMAEKQIQIRGKVPVPFARALDIALFGTISAAKTPDLVMRLKRFLRDRYAS
jgi:hypothetical protein